jgi:polyhydroxyalkanoate synthesis repressor PhaR
MRCPMAYVIKRYSNRKLYDPQQSHYVTLEALAKMIGDGKEVSVVDAATGDDLTSITLIQILLERERSHRPTLTPALLHEMIRHGGAWQDLLRESLLSGTVGMVSDPQEQDRIQKIWAARTGFTPHQESKEGAGESQGPAHGLKGLREEVEAFRAKLRALEERLLREETP